MEQGSGRKVAEYLGRKLHRAVSADDRHLGAITPL